MARDAGLEARITDAARSVPGARAVWLFGSRASGRQRPDSDVDVASSLEPELGAEARALARSRLSGAVTEELGPLGDSLDLVDLEEASATLAFRVIRDGLCLHASDRGARLAFEVRIARRYDDEAHLRRPIRRAAIRAGRRMGALADGRR